MDQNVSIDKKKWKCTQCTYENWPSAIKCTICLASKLQITNNNNNKLKQQSINSTKKPNNNNNNISQTNNKSSKIRVIKLKDKNNLNKHNESSLLLNENNNNSNNGTNLLSSSSSSNENLNEIHNISSENGGNTSDELLTQAKPTTTKTNDIYQIGQLLTNNDESISSQSIEKQKWSCHVCTYLNWPKSVKCVQCYTPKTTTTNSVVEATCIIPTTLCDDGEITTLKKSNSNTTTTAVASSSSTPPPPNLHEQFQNNLIINNNSNRSSCNSPCTVPKTIIEQKQQQQQQIGESNKNLAIELIDSTTNNNNDTSTTVVTEIKKWSCSGCTYQNWPKSQRCVMCHLQRNTTTVTKQQQQQHHQNSNSLKQIDYQQKLKTYQMQMDRLFLAACQGIVDDDMTHLNRYIHANGDLTRYLTSDEVKCLNRPNVFTVGLTLLHLCYQFKRKEFLMQILSTNKSSSIRNNNNNNNNNKKQLSGQNTSLSSSTMNLLNALLKQANKTKFSPCQSCPALASNIIERYFSANLRQRKTPNSSLHHHHHHHHHHHYNIHRYVDHHHYHHISPTTSLISLNQQLTTNNNSLINNFGNNGAIIAPLSNINSGISSSSSSNNNNNSSLIGNNNNNNTQQAFLNVTISPSPSPPPPATCGSGATSIYHYQAQSQTSLCFYVNECHTFILPNEIDDFSPRIQHILFDELLDREVQQELENESRVINWNIDLCKRLDSRLYPLWNRHSGDCLLDSVLQACYGVFDTDNTLRRIMAESLEQYANCFKPRWKEHEILMAQSLDYTLDDYQLEQDWNNIISLANQPGASLEQAHIFALCHIFRRPIIIYSIKYVKSFRGENIGFTHFEGVYLPLIWEPNFCFKSPIALGYTRGHFTALVPLERSEFMNYNNTTPAPTNNNNNNNDNTSSDSTTTNTNNNPTNNINSNNNNETNVVNNANNNNSLEAGAMPQQQEYIETQNNNQQIFYLPLANSEGQLLPIHFLNSSEVFNNF